MPYYIRVLTSKRYWDIEEHRSSSWLGIDDLPADALLNVTTKENSLSIYQLDEQGSNRDKILCAYASTRCNIAPIDYIVFSDDALSEVGLNLKDTPGKTPIDDVNKWHHDIVHISANKLVSMVKSAINDGWVLRLTKPNVKKLMQTEVKRGTVRLDQLQDGVKSSIQT